MKFIITENQNSKLKDMIKNSIDKVGVIDTIKRYKLNLKTLNKFYSEGDEFDCNLANRFIFKLISSGILKNTITTEKFGLWFDPYWHDGTVGFEYKDNESGDVVGGYATPYWDGECNTPVDITFYNNTDDEYEFDGDHFDIPSPEGIKLFEIEEWYEKVYVKNLVKLLDDFLPELRERFKKD
jgi:hypothetical protein